MGKASRRRPKPVLNGTDPGPIERAIDTAAAKAGPAELTLLINRKPIRVKPSGPESRLSVKALADPNEAPVLVRGEDGTWYGVILPPGSVFELRPSGPTAQIWTPLR